MIKILDCFNKQISSCIIISALLIVRSIAALVKVRPLVFFDSFARLGIVILSALISSADIVICLVVYILSYLLPFNRSVDTRDTMFNHIDSVISYLNEIEYPTIKEVVSLKV